MKKTRCISSFLIVLLTLIAHPANGISSRLETDAIALLSFKASIIDSRDVLTSWKTSNIASICSPWHGVICRRRSTGVRVIGLDLGNMGLAGNLTLVELNIETLERLNLSSNSFTSTVVPTFTLSLSRLKELSLQKNNFSGTLSGSDIGELSKSLYLLDLSSNNFSGSLPESISALSALKTFDVSDNYLSGPIPVNISKIPGLLDVSLANNNFTGEIPTSLRDLTSLERLNLSNNDLSGSIPPGLATLQNLTVLDLSGNLFSGQISSGFEKFNSSSFSDNSNLCGPPLSVPCYTSNSSESSQNVTAGISQGGNSTSDSISNSKSKSSVAFLIAIIVLGFFFVGLLLTAAMAFYSRYNGTSSIQPSFKEVEKPLEPSFSLSGHGRLVLYKRLDFIVGIDDIMDATENFDEKFLIGAGSYGAVYKTSLAEGNLQMAVKRLSPDIQLDEKKFQTQVNLIVDVRHPNLVPLVGSFSDPLTGERLLLFEEYSGGNLWQAIKERNLDWNGRIQAALSAARALKALHEHNPPIVHGDIKPQNILLDSQNEAYLVDFGLAQILKVRSSLTSHRPSGAAGYLAPEFVARRKLSSKTDLYAFGILLLQIVTGKTPTDPVVKGSGFPQWAMTESPSVVIDQSLDWLGDYREVIVAVLRLGLVCTAKNPEGRSSISDVEEALKSFVEFSKRIESGVSEEVSVEV